MGTEDEATFGLIPLVARGWARKGSRPTTTINHKNDCTNAFGARSVRCFVFSFSKTKKQKDFVRFAKKLLKRWKKVLLFLDSAPGHHGKLVDAFLFSHRKTFRLEYFPKYTPEVNPTEQCWKPARKCLSNRLIKTLPAAQYHLKKTFNSPEAMPKLLKYLRD